MIDVSWNIVIGAAAVGICLLIVLYALRALSDLFAYSEGNSPLDFPLSQPDVFRAARNVLLGAWVVIASIGFLLTGLRFEKPHQHQHQPPVISVMQTHSADAESEETKSQHILEEGERLQREGAAELHSFREEFFGNHVTK